MMAQQTDPTLTGAVIAQSGMLKKIFKDREKTQKKIIAAETAVTVAMDRMHKVEDKIRPWCIKAGLSSGNVSGLSVFRRKRQR